MTMAVPVTSLNSVTTGTGTTVDFSVARRTITMHVVVNNVVATGAVALDLSMNGSNWWTAGETSTLVTSTNVAVNASGVAARYARARVTSTITGAGGSVTCLIMESDV